MSNVRRKIYRWLIRQISQHNQKNVIQQKHAKRLHKVLVELCEAGADGDHVPASDETCPHFHFCKRKKNRENHENHYSPFRWLFTRRKKLLRMFSERKTKIMEKREITLVRIFFSTMCQHFFHSSVGRCWSSGKKGNMAH